MSFISMLSALTFDKTDDWEVNFLFLKNRSPKECWGTCRCISLATPGFIPGVATSIQSRCGVVSSASMQVLVRGATRWRAAGWDGDERHGGQWPFRELEGSAHSQDQRVYTCVHVRARRCKTRALVQSLHSHVAMQSRNIRGSHCLLPLCFSSFSISEWSSVDRLILT